MKRNRLSALKPLLIAGLILILSLSAVQAQRSDSAHQGVLVLQLQLILTEKGIESQIQQMKWIPQSFQPVQTDSTLLPNELVLKLAALNEKESRQSVQYIHDPFTEVLEYPDDQGRLQKLRHSVQSRNVLIRIPVDFHVRQIQLSNARNQLILNRFEIPSELFKQSTQ